MLWHRLGNVVLHALTALALFALFRRLLATVAGNASATRDAFFAALIFAVHPISVYGVAYLVERSIVMATLFSALALLAYLEGLLRASQRWYAASAALYLLALFSKEHCVMLPAVALAMTLLVRKPSWPLARELAPAYALFFAAGALIVFKTRSVVGTSYEPHLQESLGRLDAWLAQSGLDGKNLYPLSLVNQCWLFFKYLFLWLVPDPGWFAVDLRQKFPRGLLGWPETAALVAFVAYPLLAGRLLLKGGRRALAGFALLFPWLLFLTELAAVRLQEPFVLYRAYLWAAGFALVVPLVVAPIAGRWTLAVLSTICLALVPLTLNRLDTFSSPSKLWNDVVVKNADRSAFFAERGYNKRGIASIESERYAEAVRDFDTSLEINPRDANVLLNRGMARMQLGDHAGALRDFDAGIALDPTIAGFYVNRGILYATSHRYTEALAEFDRALEQKGDDAVAHFNRGLALRLAGRTEDGNAEIRKACDLGHARACGAAASR